MLLFGEQYSALPRPLERDPRTGLPLLSQEDAIVQLLLAYLPLPYSVAEYGCGKKTSIALKRLVRFGVPAWSLWRGMALERDLSPAALEETDFLRRPHALTAQNPLALEADLRDPIVRAMLDRSSASVSLAEDEIHAGPYRMRHSHTVQFAVARSHIFPILTLWDSERDIAVTRALDLTLQRERLFPVPDMRQLLHAPGALILTTPLLGTFRLDPRFLTAEQGRELSGLADRNVSELSEAEHADLVRSLTGAEEASVGDPDTWTYANNILLEGPAARRVPNRGRAGTRRYERSQRSVTGRGNALRWPFAELLAARRTGSEGLAELLTELQRLQQVLDIIPIVNTDSEWSQIELEPLAGVASSISYYNSMRRMGDELARKGHLGGYLEEDGRSELLRGLAASLRRRLEKLTRPKARTYDDIGVDPHRAFSQLALALAREMNAAGLVVAVDCVGNLHGVRLSPDVEARLAQGRQTLPALLQRALCFGSHVDSDADASHIGGWLGVASGMEVCQVLADLERYFEVAKANEGDGRTLFVSAWMGEELHSDTWSLSTPGSAAVSGHITPDAIHGLTTRNEYTFRERLAAMLTGLRAAQREGSVRLLQDLSAHQDPLNACFDPTWFFTAHSYERHIEMGPVLRDRNLALALVETTTGLRREIVRFTGAEARRAQQWLSREIGRGSLATTGEGPRMRVAGSHAFGDEASLTVEAFASTKEGLELMPAKLGEALRDAQHRFRVTPGREVTLHLEPQELAEAGQVLQLERSYYNHETGEDLMLPGDLIRGTLVQLAVARAFLGTSLDRSVNLFSLVRSVLPGRWCVSLPQLDSKVPLGLGYIAARAQHRPVDVAGG